METKDSLSVPDATNDGAGCSQEKTWKEQFSVHCLVSLLDRNVRRLLPIVLFLAAILLFSHGLQWPFYHPDEYKIAGWVDVVEKNGFIPDDAYPQGMFRLMLGCKAIEDFADRLTGWRTDWVSDGKRFGVRTRDENPKLFFKNESMIYRIRKWNVLFSALSVVLFFYLARLYFGNGYRALLPSAFLLFHPFLVEHSHYAESDIAMLFTALSTFLLFAHAFKRRSLLLLLAGAVMGGFSCSTKYTNLLILLLLPLVAIFYAHRFRLGVGKGSALVLGLLVLGLLGFTFGHPIIYSDFSAFWANLQEKSAKTYLEINGLLGDAISAPFAKKRYLLKQAIHLHSGVNPLIWVFLAGSLPLWFTKGVRKAGPMYPLFGFLFPFFVVLSFPYVRNQEFLVWHSFVVLSVFLIPAYLLNWGVFATQEGGGQKQGGESCRRPIVAGAVTLPLLFVLCGVVRDGLRMSNAFAAPDSRDSERAWLSVCAPLDILMGFDPYAAKNLRLPFRPTCILSSYEARKEGQKIEGDTFINTRTPMLPRRGCIDFRTGRLFPKYQAEYDRLMERDAIVRKWQLDGGLYPTFAQPKLELSVPAAQSAEESAASAKLASVLPPFFVHARRYGNEGLRVTAGGNNLLGPLESILVVNQRTTVFFTAPETAERYYVVVLHLIGDTPAKIQWDRGFFPESIVVSPGKADYFVSTPSLRSAIESVPSARIRMRGNDQTSYCIAAITTNPEKAASLLEYYGNSDAATRLRASVSLEEKAALAATRVPKPDMIRAFSRILWQSKDSFFVFEPDEVNVFPKPDKGEALLANYRYVDLPIIPQPSQSYILEVIPSDLLERILDLDDSCKIPLDLFDVHGADVEDVYLSSFPLDRTKLHRSGFVKHGRKKNEEPDIMERRTIRFKIRAHRHAEPIRIGCEVDPVYGNERLVDAFSLLWNNPALEH